MSARPMIAAVPAALLCGFTASTLGPIGLGCWAPSPETHPNLIGNGDAASAPPISPPRGADLASDAVGGLAWTRSAPLTLVGPGGEPVATLDRLGVLVQVLQVQSHRVRVRCLGCPAPEPPGDLWLQSGQLAGGPAADDEALSAALQLRAQWARGEGLAEGADRDAHCALIDAGFAWNTDEARFAWGGGAMLLAHMGRTWELGAVSAPTSPAPWPCAGPDPG